jgi:hypothetical protein
MKLSVEAALHNNSNRNLTGAASMAAVAVTVAQLKYQPGWSTALQKRQYCPTFPTFSLRVIVAKMNPLAPSLMQKRMHLY